MLMPNVLQGFGLEIIMIAVTAYLWAQSLRNSKTATLSAFFRLCSAFMLFLLVNVPVRILDFRLVNWGPNLVFLVNALFIAFEALTAYEWFIYFLTVQGSKSLKNRRMRMCFLIPFVLIVVLLAVSYNTGWLFYVDQNGMYARGSLFFLQLLIPYSYVAASFVSAFLNYKKTNNRRTFTIVLSAFFTSVLASVLQIFFSGSFVLAGFCLAIILIYIEMFEYEIGQIEKAKSLGNANIGLWSFELDEGCAPRMYADEAMLGLIGLDHQISPEETYHAWYDNIDPGSYDLVADAVAKMTNGEHAEVQYPWHHPNGETWIVRCGGVRNPKYAKGVRIEGTHQNVTELIHYDEELRKREERQREDEIARIKAEASDKAKTEFLFNMSHDIRTPMNAILGHTDIAINHINEQDRVKDSLEKIKTSGGHLLKLINDILEMSRIEAGKLEIVKEPLSIRKASDGVSSMSQSLADKKDITFQTIVGELENPYIYADELHTNQVLINIISNAIKYTNSGGTVLYRIEQIGPPTDGIAWYRFTVSDNGIGMSDEFQKHIFESFSREQSSTVSKLEGTGLGLAIVKKIVDKIGGTITVQSTLGEGSTFVVEIPFEVLDEKAIEAFTASQSEETIISELASFEGMRALLVEDNAMNREIATEILEETGLALEVAEDGAIAVEKVSEKGTGYYDFILMDIQMPVMNGYEATARIRELPGGSEIPVIALSANAFKEDIDRSIAAGMNAHVSKPIDIKALLDIMQKFAK